MEGPKVNGCDFWWDGNWSQCCNAHDVAFYTPGDLGDFISANVDMGMCIWNINPLMSVIMTSGVMVGGLFVWKFKGFGGKSIFEIITGKRY